MHPDAKQLSKSLQITPYTYTLYYNPEVYSLSFADATLALLFPHPHPQLPALIVACVGVLAGLVGLTGLATGVNPPFCNGIIMAAIVPSLGVGLCAPFSCLSSTDFGIASADGGKPGL